jgi:hypothetical protein
MTRLTKVRAGESEMLCRAALPRLPSFNCLGKVKAGQKALSEPARRRNSNRGERIRTSDLLNPIQRLTLLQLIKEHTRIIILSWVYVNVRCGSSRPKNPLMWADLSRFYLDKVA